MGSGGRARPRHDGSCKNSWPRGLSSRPSRWHRRYRKCRPRLGASSVSTDTSTARAASTAHAMSAPAISACARRPHDPHRRARTVGLLPRTGSPEAPTRRARLLRRALSTAQIDATRPRASRVQNIDRMPPRSHPTATPYGGARAPAANSIASPRGSVQRRFGVGFAPQNL